MKAIFYDRKHNCEVQAKQLCKINAVVTLARTKDDDELNAGEQRIINSAIEFRLGELGYKSPSCPKVKNWDRWLNYSDLVFLRFE